VSLEYATWQNRFAENDLDEKLADVLARFAKYPVSLIRGDVDLIAAWLNASARTKILLGTGLLHQAGPSLIRYYKQLDRQRRRAYFHRRNRRAGQKTDAPLP
jgi:hypothetical protein